MILPIPQIIPLIPQCVLRGRKLSAVFVRKHNLEINLEAVRNETNKVSSLSSSDWLFLIEGYKKYHAVENHYLDNFTENTGIKAEDPIEPPFTHNIAQAVSIEKIIAALSILVMDYLDLIEGSEIDTSDNYTLEKLFEHGLHTISQAFDVSPKLLRREFNKLKWSDEETLGKQLLALSEKRKQLIAESNSQSEAKLAEILNRNRHPNLFIMTGIEHAPVFIGKGN